MEQKRRDARGAFLSIGDSTFSSSLPSAAASRRRNVAEIRGPIVGIASTIGSSEQLRIQGMRQYAQKYYNKMHENCQLPL